MPLSRKGILSVAAGALLLGGCAYDPYYDDDGYDGYRYDRYGYAYDRPYAGGYAGPSIGLGFSYFHWDHGHRGHWRDHDHRRWHADRGHRGGRGPRQDGPDRRQDWRGDHGQHSPG